MGILTRRTTCRLCGGRRLELVLNLGSTPPANDFVHESKLGESQECFPLEVFQCVNCNHVQLLDVVDPEHLFRNYLYVSKTSPVFVKHLEDYADWVITRFKVRTGSFVVEVASNDGTLLNFFRSAGMRTLGIEPAKNLAKMARDSGIETLPEFFSPPLAKQIRQQLGAAKVVAANNVFAHVDDLAGFARGVRELLDEDGIFVFEVSYLADVYEKILFDTIYHEHLSYHTVAPLKAFFVAQGLELIDVLRVESQGGSLRGIVQPIGGPAKASDNVSNLIQMESDLGLDRLETMKKFALKIDSLRHELVDLLRGLKEQRKSIAGFGAPAKATTLMYYFGLGDGLLDFIVDENPLKQGLYSPGLHIPVLPVSALYERKPDYVLILAWNFARSIIERHSAFPRAGGKFILPIPTVQIC